MQTQELTEQNYRNLTREQRGVLIAQKWWIMKTTSTIITQEATQKAQ